MEALSALLAPQEVRDDAGRLEPGCLATDEALQVGRAGMFRATEKGWGRPAGGNGRPRGMRGPRAFLSNLEAVHGLSVSGSPSVNGLQRGDGCFQLLGHALGDDT